MNLDPANIKVRYDDRIAALTGVKEDECMVSEGAPFMMLLVSVFHEHPEIEKTYPPGVLGFTVNGVPPDETTLLNDGDVVEFLVSVQ